MKYYPELDGVRAMAALAVVLVHTDRATLPGGVFGVDIFFVLSGYLTTSIAVSHRYTFKGFIWRRFIRVWPLMAFVSFCVGALLFSVNANGLVVWPSLVFLQTFFSPHLSPMGHTWTLTMEMSFYILIAFLAYFRLDLLRISLALYVLCVTSRYALPVNSIYYLPGPHSSGLFLGAILATSKFTLPKPFVNLTLITSLGMFVLVAILGENSIGGLPTAILVAEWVGVGITAACISSPSWAGILLRWKPIRYLGWISYGIYIWHIPVLVFFKDKETVPKFIATVLTTIILASLTYYFLEKPLLAKRPPRKGEPHDHDLKVKVADRGGFEPPTP